MKRKPKLQAVPQPAEAPTIPPAPPPPTEEELAAQEEQRRVSFTRQLIDQAAARVRASYRKFVQILPINFATHGGTRHVVLAALDTDGCVWTYGDGVWQMLSDERRG